jgi:hypothetical protein
MRAGSPADRDPGQRRHHAADVDRATERDAAGPAHLRAVEDPGAGGDEHLVGDPAAGQVRVRAGQHVITHDERVLRGAAQHRVLHDHAVVADLDRAALGGQHRAVHDAAAAADADVAAQHRAGRDVGLGVD